jgi:hypothetical protein
VTLGILCGSLIGVGVTVLVVLSTEGGGSNDGTGWAWLDVVSIKSTLGMILPSTDSKIPGLRHSVREVNPYRVEIHSPGLCKLQAPVDNRMVDHTATVGLQRWCAEHASTTHR